MKNKTILFAIAPFLEEFGGNIHLDDGGHPENYPSFSDDTSLVARMICSTCDGLEDPFQAIRELEQLHGQEGVGSEGGEQQRITDLIISAVSGCSTDFSAVDRGDIPILEYREVVDLREAITDFVKTFRHGMLSDIVDQACSRYVCDELRKLRIEYVAARSA